MLHTTQNNLIQPNSSQVIQQGVNYQVYNMSGSQTIDAYQIQEANKLQCANNQLSGQVANVAPVQTQAWDQVNYHPQVFNQLPNQPTSNTSHHQHQTPNQVQMAYYVQIPNQVDKQNSQVPYQVQISYTPISNEQHQVQMPYSVQSASQVQKVNPIAEPQVQYQVQTHPQTHTVNRTKTFKPIAMKKQAQDQITGKQFYTLQQIQKNNLKMAGQKYQAVQQSVPKPGRMYPTRGRPSKKQVEMRAMLMKQDASRNIYPNIKTVGPNEVPFNYQIAVGNVNCGQYQSGEMFNNYGQQQVYTVQQPIGISNKQKQESGIVNINYGQYNQYVVLNQQSSGLVNKVGHFQQQASLVANSVNSGQYQQQSSLVSTNLNNRQLLQKLNGKQAKVQYQQVINAAQTQPIPRKLNQRQLQTAVKETKKCGVQNVQNSHTEIINIELENLLSKESASAADFCDIKEIESLLEEITSGQSKKPEESVDGYQASLSMPTLHPPSSVVESFTTPTIDDIISSYGDVSVDGRTIDFEDLLEYMISGDDMGLMSNEDCTHPFKPLTPPETPFLN